jgi:hypothetical protein
MNREAVSPHYIGNFSDTGVMHVGWVYFTLNSYFSLRRL